MRLWCIAFVVVAAVVIITIVMSTCNHDAPFALPVARKHSLDIKEPKPRTITPRIADQNTASPVAKQIRPRGANDGLAERTRYRLHRIFEPLLDALGLTPDQRLRVEDLMVERYLSGADARALLDQAHRTGGGISTSDEVAALQHKIDDEVHKQIQQMVGEQAAAKIDRWVRATPFFTPVQMDYAPKFSAAGVPLEPLQAAELAVILSDAGQSTTKMSWELRVDPQSGLSETDEYILHRAEKLLDSQQLATLRQTLSEHTARLKDLGKDKAQ